MSTTRKERQEECVSRKEYIFVVDLSVISCFHLSEEDSSPGQILSLNAANILDTMLPSYLASSGDRDRSERIIPRL